MPPVLDVVRAYPFPVVSLKVWSLGSRVGSRLLAQHQEVQAKLREECLAVSNKTLDRDVLKGMKYLRCILKEGRYHLLVGWS